MPAGSATRSAIVRHVPAQRRAGGRDVVDEEIEILVEAEQAEVG